MSRHYRRSSSKEDADLVCRLLFLGVMGGVLLNTKIREVQRENEYYRSKRRDFCPAGTPADDHEIAGRREEEGYDPERMWKDSGFWFAAAAAFAGILVVIFS